MGPSQVSLEVAGSTSTETVELPPEFFDDLERAKKRNKPWSEKENVILRECIKKGVVVHEVKRLIQQYCGTNRPLQGLSKRYDDFANEMGLK